MLLRVNVDPKSVSVKDVVAASAPAHKTETPIRKHTSLVALIGNLQSTKYFEQQLQDYHARIRTQNRRNKPGVFTVLLSQEEARVLPIYNYFSDRFRSLFGTV